MPNGDQTLLRDTLPVAIPLAVAWLGWVYQKRRRRIAMAHALWRDAKPVRLPLPHAQEQVIASLPHAQLEVWRNNTADVTDLFPAQVVSWLTDAWWQLAQGYDARREAAAVERAMCWYIRRPLDTDAEQFLAEVGAQAQRWNPRRLLFWQRSLRKAEPR